MTLKNNQRGITLVELILTIVILAIALLGIILGVQMGTNRSSDITLEVRAVALAQAYLDEILGKRFDERSRPRGIPPCHIAVPASRQCTAEVSFGADYGSPIEPGESSRSRLDDVDDYHNMNEGDGEALPLQDAQGNTRIGYENFSVHVNVRYINLGGGEEEENLPENNELDDQYDAKLVTVTVNYRGLSTGWDFSAYKSNF